MNRIIYTIAAVLSFLAFTPVSGAVPPLRFRSDGKLKILQFTDTHMTFSKKEEYEKTRLRLIKAIETENPDFVVFTGDQIWGAGAKTILKEYFEPLDERGIPFAVVYGNHDREQKVLSERQMALAYTSHPCCVNKMTADSLLCDIAVPVCSSVDGKAAAVIYCIDSGDYVRDKGDFSGYAWIPRRTIDWYSETGSIYTTVSGRLLPSYMFFHIPLPEYTVAYDQGKVLAGSRGEKECVPKVNSGMLSAILENGDVHGIFCGHDHDNDYVATLGGVAFVYGRYSGDDTVYNHLPRGFRVIELTEGCAGFRTWIRQDDGQVVGDVVVDVTL